MWREDGGGVGGGGGGGRGKGSIETRGERTNAAGHVCSASINEATEEDCGP